MTCLRQTLNKHYGTKPVGLGGAFLIESGKARLHVMVSITHCTCTVEKILLQVCFVQISYWMMFICPETCLYVPKVRATYVPVFLGSY